MSNIHSSAEKEPHSLVRKTKQTLAEIADVASRWAIGGWPMVEPRVTQDMEPVFQESAEESEAHSQAVTR